MALARGPCSNLNHLLLYTDNRIIPATLPRYLLTRILYTLPVVWLVVISAYTQVRSESP